MARRKDGQPSEPLAYFMLDKVCAECGKDFCIKCPEEYAYKRRAKSGRVAFMCSWHCLQQYDKTHSSGRRGHIGSRERDRIIEMLDKGIQCVDIAEVLGVSMATVRYWRDYRRTSELAGG